LLDSTQICSGSEPDGSLVKDEKLDELWREEEEDLGEKADSEDESDDIESLVETRVSISFAPQDSCSIPSAEPPQALFDQTNEHTEGRDSRANLWVDAPTVPIVSNRPCIPSVEPPGSDRFGEHENRATNFFHAEEWEEDVFCTHEEGREEGHTGDDDDAELRFETSQVLAQFEEVGMAHQRVEKLEAQLLYSSQQLKQAAEEIDRLVEHNLRLEQKLAVTVSQLQDARLHVSRHDLALQVLEKELADILVLYTSFHQICFVCVCKCIRGQYDLCHNLLPESVLAATIPFSLPFPYLMLLLMYAFVCADQRNKAQADKTLEQAEAERERLQLKTAETQELLRKNQEALSEAELHNIKVCGDVDTFFKSNEQSVKSQCLVCSILFHYMHSRTASHRMQKRQRS